MNISAVVVTYNRLADFKRNVACLLGQTDTIVSINIINNNSTDGTKEYLDDLATSYPSIRPYHLEDNRGGAYGFWYGIKETLLSNIDFLWIMDDDCFPDHDCLTRLMEGFIDEDVMAVSPVVLCVNGEIDLQHRRKVIWPAVQEIPLQEEDYRQRLFVECKSSSFVGPVFRRDIFQLIGLPRNDLFFQFDDTEFFARIDKHGYKSLLNPLAFVVHGGSKMYPADLKTSPGKIYYSLRNKIVVGGEYNEVNARFIYPILLDSFRFLRAARKQGLNMRDVTVGIYRGIRDGLQNKLGKVY